MSKTNLLSNKSVKFYLLDLIDIRYIDLEKSYVSPSGETMFRIDISKLPECPAECPDQKTLLEKTIFDLTFNYGCIKEKICGNDKKSERRVLPNGNDKYYIVYDSSAKAPSVTFMIIHNKIPMEPKTDFIRTTMKWLNDFDKSNYKQYRKRINKFAERAKEIIKEKIRNRLFGNDIAGEFIHDDIVRDTYLHRRNIDGRRVVYIIYEWYRHLLKGTVQWVDIDNGKGNVFVTLND